MHCTSAAPNSKSGHNIKNFKLKVFIDQDSKTPEKVVIQDKKYIF